MMVHLHKLKIVAAVSVILPAVLVATLGNWWSLVVFIVWTAAAAAFWIIMERRQHALQLQRSGQALQTMAIHTLNHHRHDWMNDLQVLYGYIRMNKPDRIVQYVEKIRERMVMESRISKLGIGSLILYIYSFRTISQSMQLEVDVQGEVNLAELPIDGEALSQALIGIINAYRFAVKPVQTDPATLKMSVAKQGQDVWLSFELSGECCELATLKQQLNEQLDGRGLKLAECNSSFTKVVLKTDQAA